MQETGTSNALVEQNNLPPAIIEYQPMSRVEKLLTPRQMRAVEMILLGKSNAEVASMLRVARETVSRWRALPQFKAELESAILQQKADVAESTQWLLKSAIQIVEDTLLAIHRKGAPPTLAEGAFAIKALQLIVQANSQLRVGRFPE